MFSGAAIFSGHCQLAGTARATMPANTALACSNRLTAPAFAACSSGAVQPAMPVAWTLASGRSDTDIAEAHRKAHECDPVSAFGGIIATNRPVTKAMADTVKDIRSGDQVEADAASWNPPTEDLYPGVIGTW